jgi:erythromycin esterase-like protein
MGKHLAQALGDDYRVLALTFGQGAYWTTDFRPPKAKFGRVTVGPPPPHTFEAMLGRADFSHFVDLRAAPADVARLLETARPMRVADEAFTDESSMEVSFPPRAYDAVVYVPQSSPLLRISPLPQDP